MGAVGPHAVEGYLLAIRHRPRDGKSALAVRDQCDRVAAEWAEGAGQAIEAVCDCDGGRHRGAEAMTVQSYVRF